MERYKVFPIKFFPNVLFPYTVSLKKLGDYVRLVKITQNFFGKNAFGKMFSENLILPFSFRTRL